RKGALDLVSLQVTDQVPMDGGRKERGLVPEFLRPAFTQFRDAGFGQQGSHGWRHGLGDGHEEDVAAFAAGPAAGRLHPRVDRGDALGKTAANLVLLHDRRRLPEGVWLPAFPLTR